MGRSLRFAVAISAIGIVAISVQPLTAGPFNVITAEMDAYLVIATGDGVAYDTSNTEIGADQEVVTSSDISDPQQRVGGSGTGFNGVGGLPTGSAPDLQSTFFPGNVRNDLTESIAVPDENRNGTTGTEQTNNRWNDIDPSAGSGADVVGTPDTLGIAGDGFADARPLFEGIDWSGNVAITHSGGAIHTSNTDVNANLGIRCAGSANDCDDNISNTAFFDAVSSPNTAQALAPGTGIAGDVVHTGLLAELDALKTAIAGATSELTITRDFDKFNFSDDASPGLPDSTPVVLASQADMDALAVHIDADTLPNRGPLIIDLDLLDADNDGIVVIDVDRGDAAFSITNSDVILTTSEDTLAIFRAVNGLYNYDFENSSIMMGEPDWDLATNPLGLNGEVINDLGALFVIDMFNGQNVVFDLDNVILGGIGLYDLIDLYGTGPRITEIDIDNAQGCAQFVSNHVDMQNNRWNRCVTAGGGVGLRVPEPATFAIFGLGLVGLGFMRRRQRAA